MREPLVPFLLAGALLFAGYRWLHPPAGGRDASYRIVVTDDDLRQISVTWLAQGRPPPTPEQMQSLVASWVRDEVLFREALALGLDQNDTIVKRRMVQKMEFLAEDLSELREPSRPELEAWFQGHAGAFSRPARATFRQLYFSPDRRGAGARVAAERALARLTGRPADAPEAAALADPAIFQDQYSDRTPDEVAKDFGPPFAKALFELEPGAWRGPVESGFGWQLVFVESVAPGRVPLFEEVVPEVREAWLDARREEVRRQSFEQMRSRYQVVVPDDLTPRPLAGGVGRGAVVE